MNECQKPKQIHLMDLLLYCLEKWRWIVGCMLVVAILLGTRTYLQTVKENKALQSVQQAAEETVDAGSTEETEEETELPVGSYEKAIQEIEHDLEIQEDYLDRSVVMKMDPYHISVGNLSYYVEGGEHMSSVVAAYNTFITSGRMAEELYAQESDIPVEDLRYLITFTNTDEAQNQGSIFQIQIKMPESGLAETYLSNAKEIVQEYTSQLQEKIAEHQVTLLGSTQSEMSDLDMQKYQSTVRTGYMTEVKNLQLLRADAAKQSAEANVSSTPATVPVVLKNPAALAKKSAVNGLALGAGLSLAILLVLYLFGNRLQDAESFQADFKMPLLGLVRLSEAKKRVFGFVDTWLFRFRGGYYGQVSLEEQVKIAAVNVQAAISKNNQGQQAKIMLAGTVAEKEVELLCTKLVPEIQAAVVSPYRRLVFQSSALKELEEYDGVIFLEKRGGSHCEFIEQERQLVLDRDVEVLGTIVVC